MLSLLGDDGAESHQSTDAGTLSPRPGLNGPASPTEHSRTNPFTNTAATTPQSQPHSWDQQPKPGVAATDHTTATEHNSATSGSNTTEAVRRAVDCTGEHNLWSTESRDWSDAGSIFAESAKYSESDYTSAWYVAAV